MVKKKEKIEQLQPPKAVVLISTPNNTGMRNEYCYSNDTEILTEDGWKLFKDLTRKEKVVTLNPLTNEIEYQLPLDYYEYDGEREMFSQCGRHVDLMVTLQHKLWVGVPNIWRQKWKWEFRMASQLPKIYKIKRDGKWNGIEQKNFFLPKVNGKNTIQKDKIIMDNWLAFFGIWLAEGSCYQNKSGYSVTIAQIKKNVSQRIIIEKILDKISFSYWYDGEKEYHIKNKQLWNYLKQFGHAKDKYIPRNLLLLSSRQLKILFDSMLLGDGSYSKGKYQDYSTISKQLKDNVQELLLKIGLAGTITEKGVGISYKQLTPTLNRKDERKLVYYFGKVYGLEVGNHIIYIRRNGKACWSGNSVNAMMSLCWVAGAYGIQIINGTYDEHPISLARNIACEEFLKNEKITHILFIDSDTVPNPDMLLKLLSYDVPIVSGWYLSRKGSGLPVAFKIEGTTPQTMLDIVNDHTKFPKWRAYRLDEFLTLPKDKKGLVQVDGVGAGALLIKREALPHLFKPYFLEDVSQKYGFGEDLWFSLNCKIAKVPIYVDLNCFCKHWTWGLIDMRHVQALIQRQKQVQMQQQMKPDEKPPM